MTGWNEISPAELFRNSPTVTGIHTVITERVARRILDEEFDHLTEALIDVLMEMLRLKEEEEVAV